MSDLIRHVPDPAFWKKYYTDQARGKTYARAMASHRTIGQGGGSVKNGVRTVIKTVSPLQQTYDRAQSQIKRKIEEVGGVTKKRRIKTKSRRKAVTSSKGKQRVKKSKPKTKSRKSPIHKKKKKPKKRDIFS